MESKVPLNTDLKAAILANPAGFYAIDDSDRDFVRINLSELVPYEALHDHANYLIKRPGVADIKVMIREDRGQRQGYTIDRFEGTGLQYIGLLCAKR